MARNNFYDILLLFIFKKYIYNLADDTNYLSLYLYKI